MKRALFSFALLAGLTQPVWAQQLRYTTHVETRPVSRAPSGTSAAAPAYENLSVSMYDALLTDVKGQPYDITTVVNDQALRVESTAPRQGFPPGSVLILRPDRQLLVANPQTRTYSTVVSSPLVPRRPAAKPELSWRRTGESDQIAGARVERVTFELTLTQPPLDAGQAPPATPPGPPLRVVINGEAWVAPQYASFASLLARSYPYAPYAFPFLEELEKQGFVMRLVLRSELFGGVEIERRITRITEEMVAMDAFRPPDGYREALETRAEIQTPQILTRVQPTYTPEALQAKIAGSVLIEATVAADGSVQDARILRSLDSKYGLDDQALAAVRQWRFKPGTLDGKPVSVRVTVEVGFSIKTQP